MEFKIKSKDHPNIPKYSSDDFQIAKKFADAIKVELGEFLKCAILFGSVARQEKLPSNDVDVLLIINDLTMVANKEVVSAYQVIVQNTASKVSKRLHITTMKLTNVWDYVRNGDPIVTNMLRDGVPLLDVGIFEPLQSLLFEGRIKPTKESVWVYYTRAPTTILNAEWHVLQAALDLYWAVVDAAHAALMKVGEVPPSPSHIASLMDKKLVKERLCSKRSSDTMDFFYKLSKKITHRELQKITGKEFDDYKKRAEEFIKDMEKIIVEK